MAAANRRRFIVPDIDDAVSDFQELGLMVFNRPRPLIISEPAEPSVRPDADDGASSQQQQGISAEDTVAENVTKLVTCDCHNTCQRKGCPCKTANELCSNACTCKGSKTKPCQNRPRDENRACAGYARENDPPSNQTNGRSEPNLMTSIDVKGVLSSMAHQELLDMAADFFEVRQSLLIDMLNRRNASLGPTEEATVPRTVPSWCKCKRCFEMPTAKERKCCKRAQCLTMDQTFYDICLNGTTLEVAINSQCDIRVDIPRQDPKTMRHMGYRQFVMWQHGPLGAGNRVVIPSCCVWKIRHKYPSTDNRYTGYKDH